MSESYNQWHHAKKKPIIVKYREVQGEKEEIHTREGILTAWKGKDYVIQGINGELYPIGKAIFEKTYDVIEGVV